MSPTGLAGGDLAVTMSQAAGDGISSGSTPLTELAGGVFFFSYFCVDEDTVSGRGPGATGWECESVFD